MIELSAYTKNFLSHPIENEKHLLIEHLITVATRAEKFFSKTKFKNKRIVFYSGLLHDIGKLNPFYQELFNEIKDRDKLTKDLQKKYDQVHSPLSAWAADKLLSKNLGLDTESISKILILIYGHHSKIRNSLGGYDENPLFLNSKNQMIPNLKEFSDQISKISEFSGLSWDTCLEKFKRPVNFDVALKQTSDNGIKSFLEMMTAFSCLLQADRGSFTEIPDYKFDLKINTETLKNDSKLAELRTEFQKQVIENFDSNEPLIIINAPTGIGKTKVFLDLISKYSKDKNVERVFYFSPLLALTDDFEKKLLKVISKEDIDQILSYNHIFAGTIEEKRRFENGLGDSIKWSFPIETFNKKFVVTTTQRLLMTLYSNKQRENLKLASFQNSILIIDEIQTIPKFILANLKQILLNLNQYLGTKSIFVSATIPNEISDLKQVKVDDSIIQKYLEITKKSINMDQLELQNIPSLRTLVMANTRKKAVNIFSQICDIHKDKTVLYLSTGIRKKDRKAILDEVSNKEKNDFILVSTQVVEAGVDISFSNIYREIAPLDSIIQVMGRLNREGVESQAKLIVYESDGDYKPYSELEFTESFKHIRKISDSLELYSNLPKYYKNISAKNTSNTNKIAEIESYIKKLDFEEVWSFVNRHVLLDDEKDTVFVPDSDEWDNVKFALMNNLPKDTYKKYGLFTVSLPFGIKIDYHMYFDNELLEKNILLPKKEMLDQVYDKTMGLDKWLMTS